MNRTVGFLSALIGGSFGFIASLLVFLENNVTGPLWLWFLFSLLAIAGSLVFRSKGTVGGVILIVAAVGVFFTVPMFNLIAAILILITGLMGVATGEQNQS